MESGVFWCSQVLDLNLLALVFYLMLTVDSRRLHLYGTDDKTSWLIMKSFSTVRDTRKGTQSYGEEKREEGDGLDQEDKGGNLKERDRSSQQSFP